MEIKSEIFIAFYKLLLDKLFSEVLEAYPDNSVPKASKKIWLINNRVTGKPFILQVFHDTPIVDPLHYYRINCKAENSHTLNLNRNAFIDALLYIGIDYPSHVPKTKQEKLEVLFQEFLNQGVEGEQEPSPIPVPTPPTSRPIKHPVEHVIKDFFSSIALGNYKKAWNSLTPKFQNRDVWAGDLNKFAKGYTNTVKIEDVSILNLTEKFSSVDCQVSYQDVVNTYTIPDLLFIPGSTIGDFEKFEQAIKKLKTKFGKYKKFNEIKLEMLFKPTISEYLWYTLDIDPKDIEKVFGIQSVETVVTRHQLFSCEKNEKKYLINSIKTNPVVPILV